MSHTFLRWVRFGVAAALDNNVLEPALGPRAQLTIGIDVGATGLGSSNLATLPIEVLGPGDVAGIDHCQVVRTFPAPNTRDFEAQYLAHVEFDRVDLPWLFTPAGTGTAETLRPWICLAVIAKREGVTLKAGTPLPRLTIPDGAGAELPNLADAHLWAHAQLAGELDAAIDVIADNSPERFVSRLICSRALNEDTSYFACVVPTYNVGVAAGLGREVAKDTALDEAWTAAASQIELPVYFHWEFATGRSGDFKSLVIRLRAQRSISGVGTRALDVTSPGFGLDDRMEPTTVPLGGALCVTQPDSPPSDATLADDLADALAADGVTPPIYGRWHAGVTRVARAAGAPGWLEALNLDARYRVAAGLGAQVVQERQEDLMAAVWLQFGEILRANQLLRHAQLAIAASKRIMARHFAPLADLELLSLAGPALARVRVSTQRTARRTIVESCAPLIAFSGAFRRLIRIRGPLGRRFTRFAHPGVSDILPAPGVSPASLLASLAAGTWNVGRPPLPSGAIAAPESPGRERPSRVNPLAELGPIFNRLRQLDRAPTCQRLDHGQLGAQVRAALEPDAAIPRRVRAQISVPSNARVHLSDRLDPIMAAPEILTPMIGPLQQQGQEWLLPGIGNVPPNTVTIVEPEPAFIEAYLVGLNHEMGREMLWRGFPTDQRGTVFSRFWDRRGTVPPAVAPVPPRDIPALAEWQAADPLGSHLDPTTGAGLVLLIRGDLLVRYPRATIFMQCARWQRNPNGEILFDGATARREPVPLPDETAWAANVHFPSMTRRSGSDIVFLGFPLSPAAARGHDRTGLSAKALDSDAGWYVVFQEQPTEPRFGYPTPQATLPSGVTTSEGVAAALLRKAFRLFVHASDLIAS
jgi:hypothetical protein